MSITNDIKKLLDIQDENIIFENPCIEEGTFKGNSCTYLKGKLTYEPVCCEECGVKNKDYTIYKNGTQVSRITLPMTGVKPTYLQLKKQRFFCKACHSSFTAKSPIVEKHCFISKQTCAHILIKATESQSITSIARDCYVSPTTALRVISEEVKPYKLQYQSLPDNLSFDEFKYAKGKMAFEYINAETGDILGILDQRDGRTIKNHFIANYQLSELKKVQTITIDMNAGYVGIIQNIFPQANIIIDRFHLVQLINRAMNKCRIQIMNHFQTSNSENMKKYRRLKRYWKLLLKNEKNLLHTEYKYYPLFGQRLEVNIIEEMLSYDEVLKANYKLYQSLLSSLTNRDYFALEKVVLGTQDELISTCMRTSLKTLKKHLPFIKNSFVYPYNNGRIEGINNKIKVLNRVAYGYRNFTNYKNRIILHFKLKPIINKKTLPTTA